MKIHIVTVFKTENCGSFWQAWALKEKLSSYGNDVSFCNYKSQSNTYTKKIINIIKCCLRLRFKRAENIIERSVSFKKYHRELKIASAKEMADLYIFGSDTLWNFDDNFFVTNAAFFSGGNIERPCYSYSISVASTSRENFIKVDEAIANIQKFKRIAVRDKHTRNLVSEIYPSDSIEQTVDPTMLIDKETYLKKVPLRPAFSQKTLAVYYFGAIPVDTWKALKAFAQKKGLSIVNVGIYEKQFDYTMVSTPTKFISAFSGAEYIFTNTFHGCVFSTIFNKPFATDGAHKKKIEGFLEEFSLLDRVISSPEDVEKVLETPVDYVAVNALVKEKRDGSIAYLEQCLREVKGHE